MVALQIQEWVQTPLLGAKLVIAATLGAVLKWMTAPDILATSNCVVRCIIVDL